MGWIKERIETEKRKHGSMPSGLKKFNLDWARLAEGKILLEINEIINDWNTLVYKKGLACDKTLSKLKTMISGSKQTTEKT